MHANSTEDLTNAELTLCPGKLVVLWKTKSVAEGPSQRKNLDSETRWHSNEQQLHLYQLWSGRNNTCLTYMIMIFIENGVLEFSRQMRHETRSHNTAGMLFGCFPLLLSFYCIARSISYTFHCLPFLVYIGYHFSYRTSVVVPQPTEVCPCTFFSFVPYYLFRYLARRI